MRKIGEEEEVVGVSGELVLRLRESLERFLRELSTYSIGKSRSASRNIGPGRISRDSYWAPHRIVVVDGGSNIISLNAGFIGIVASVGVVIEGNSVVKRLIGGPRIVPSRPRDLIHYDSLSLISGVVDKLREALVFELALKALEYEPDLILVDGPIIPYSALAKRVLNTADELEAFKEYKRNVLELHKRSKNLGVSVTGFVKRPRSSFLYASRLLDERVFDHVFLSTRLKPGEYYPSPPTRIPVIKELFHEPEVLDIADAIKPAYTFMRFTESTPPYRIDFGYLSRSYEEVLAYLYFNRTREGIPYPIMKADEETKISRKLIRELYEDVLHSVIFMVKEPLDYLISLLPEYGGI